MARKPKSDEYAYVLDWIKEASEARTVQNQYVQRTVKAYQGEPLVNRYKQQLNTYADAVSLTDSVKGKLLKDTLKDIPDKKNLTLHNAVETVVSMAQGGVGRFEFGPYDPDMDQDDETVDKLASAAKHFYNTEKIDSIIPIFIRNAVLSGASYMHVKQKKGKKCATLLDSSNVLTDPKRMKTNYQRFIGFHQRESWRAVKNRTTKTKGGFLLKTINDADVYVTQITQELNGVLDANPADEFLHQRLRRDLDIFYKPLQTQILEIRKDNPDYQYGGDEIEITYLYDLMNDMYFEVINRKYIIVGKANDLKRTVESTFTDHKGKTHKVSKEIKLDHPLIELPYLKTFWDAYPISPLFYILEDFDDLCAMESVLFHNLSIMAPITFIGQSSDAERVSKAASIAGEIVEGLPQTFSVLDKTHDITSVITAITRYEDRIKRIIKATDPFEMQAMLGDRASAKEVSSLSGQISQGLNPFIANIETAMAELGEKFMKLEMIFGGKDRYPFVHNGKYAELEASDMAADYEVTAKLTSSIKLEQETNSRKALELVQYLAQSEAVDKKQFLGTLIPIILTNLVTREQATKMVTEEYRPMNEEVVAQIRVEEERRAKMHPADKLDLSMYDSDQLDEMIAQVGGAMFDPNKTINPENDGTVVNPQVGPDGNLQLLPEENPEIMDPEQQPESADPAAPGTVTIPTGSGIPAGAAAAGEVANDPARTGY